MVQIPWRTIFWANRATVASGNIAYCKPNIKKIVATRTTSENRLTVLLYQNHTVNQNHMSTNSVVSIPKYLRIG